MKRLRRILKDSPSQREDATTPLRRKYTKDTPGQVFKEDGIGPEFDSARVPIPPVGLSIREWAERPETIERYQKKYGNQAKIKLNEAIRAFSNSKNLVKAK